MSAGGLVEGGKDGLVRCRALDRGAGALLNYLEVLSGGGALVAR